MNGARNVVAAFSSATLPTYFNASASNVGNPAQTVVPGFPTLPAPLPGAPAFSPQANTVITASTLGSVFPTAIVTDNSAVLNVSSVTIPPWVEVNVRDFHYLIFNVASQVSIHGSLKADGTRVAFIGGNHEVSGNLSAVGGDGASGPNGYGGLGVPQGTRGGKGGDGGTSPGTFGFNGQGGRGLGGGGSGGSTEGTVGSHGNGPENSPGQPTFVKDGLHSCGSAYVGGGAAGGSNGTKGGQGIGYWYDGYFVSGPRFGTPSIGLTPQPAGGGSGAGAGCGYPSVDSSYSAIGGAGGGGGGGGGAFIFEATGTLAVTGSINVNGGNGGNGGSGGVTGTLKGLGGGGGGGGAGGTIILQGTTITVPNGIAALQAQGGNGGQAGAGGGGALAGAVGPAGGGGHIVLRSPSTIPNIPASTPPDVSGQAGGSPVVEIQQMPVCSPTISSVKVNGQNTNTLIAGTSGFFTVAGTCLGNATVNVSGTGVTVTSQNGDSDTQVNAYFQSTSGISGGIRTLTAVSANGQASSQIFVTGISLQVFIFDESIAYARDCFGATAVTVLNSPQWPPTATSTCPQLPTFAGDHVVYASGSKMKGAAVFGLNPAPAQGFTIPYVEGTTATAGTFKSSYSVSVPNGTVSFTVPVEADTPFPANRTQFINPLAVTWRVSQAETSCSNPIFVCSPAGSSSNPVYVTLAAPKLPSNYGDLLLTYVSLAVGNGGSTNETEAFLSTWGRFSTGSGPAHVSTWMGEFPIYYPANVGFEGCSSSAKPLLTALSGRGQCNSFAQLFLSALAANGIPIKDSPDVSSPSATTTGVCVTDNSVMVINNWSFNTSFPRYPGEIYHYAFTLAGNEFVDMVPPPLGYGSVAYGDLANESGLGGQNSHRAVSQYPIAPANTPSEKAFGSHYIVHALLSGISGDRYFDPSYGTTYSDAAAFQSKSVAGFAVNDPHPNLPQGTTNMVVRDPGPLNITLTDDAPSAPELQSPPGGATGVSIPTELRWLPSSGLVGYYFLELSTDASFATPLVGNVNGTTVSVPGLAPSTQYFWRVTANNCLGYRTSSVRSFRTAP